MTSDVLVRRARALLAVSAFCPGVVFVAYTMWVQSVFQHFDIEYLGMAAGATAVFLLLGLWTFLATRHFPDDWRGNGTSGGFATVGMIGQGVSSWFETHLVATVAVTILIVAITWLPILTARQLVRTNMLDLADSSLNFHFRGRGKHGIVLMVTPNDVMLVKHTNGSDRLRVPYSLADVEAVEVRTESRPTEWSITGEDVRTLVLAAGEIVCMTVSDGLVAFDPAEPQQVRRLIEARVALAREAAVDQ